jgi:hypothetical protein
MYLLNTRRIGPNIAMSTMLAIALFISLSRVSTHLTTGDVMKSVEMKVDVMSVRMRDAGTFDVKKDAVMRIGMRDAEMIDAAKNAGMKNKENKLIVTSIELESLMISEIEVASQYLSLGSVSYQASKSLDQCRLVDRCVHLSKLIPIFVQANLSKFLKSATVSGTDFYR